VGHLEPPKEVGVVFASLGNACRLFGNFSQAIEYQTQYLAIAKEVCDREGEGGAYLSIGKAYMSLGDLSKAIEYHKQGLGIAEEVGYRVGEAKAGSSGLRINRRAAFTGRSTTTRGVRIFKAGGRPGG
jgi:tetratricopeptide (TPR) repeat protein